jgi:hypothetical protein
VHVEFDRFTDFPRRVNEDYQKQEAALASESEFVTALLTFNVGVEAGQLAVIAAAFMLVGWHCTNRTWYRSRIVVPVSALIACTAFIGGSSETNP